MLMTFRNNVRQKGLITGSEGEIILLGFANRRDIILTTDKGIKTPKIVANNFNALHDPRCRC